MWQSELMVTSERMKKEKLQKKKQELKGEPQKLEKK